MSLYLRTAGDAAPAAGTLLFLHGFPFDGSIWDDQMAALPAGWRGLAPDLRGFGRSPLHARPDDVSGGRRIGAGVAREDEAVLTMSLLADDAARTIEEEVDGPVVVCGLSMGGYVAFELVRRRPDLVRALVLVDTRAEGDSDEARENRRRTAGTARQHGAEPVVAAMLPALFAPATREERPEVVQRVRRSMLATPPETLIAALAGMATRHDAVADLPRIRAPALVVVGAEDAITPVDSARLMADTIPGGELEIIRGAGHLSPVEQPEVFNRVLERFLENV